MAKSFKHKAQILLSDKPLIYTALSKHLFYYRMFISKFVLEQNAISLNPFMVFDYLVQIYQYIGSKHNNVTIFY